MTTDRRQWRFYGRVQGVGFRFFCEEAALSFGIRGWVRNEPDGTVRMEAEAEPDVLTDLLKHLQTGHPLARVDRVDEASVVPRGDGREGFCIQ